jgi:hypothetical protein
MLRQPSRSAASTTSLGRSRFPDDGPAAVGRQLGDVGVLAEAAAEVAPTVAME